MSAHIVLLRGLSVAPWDLRPHERLTGEYRVSVLVAPGNLYSTSELKLERRPVRTLSALVPGETLGRLAARGAGERFVGLARALAGADIVHAAELGNWYSAQAAALKRRLGFKLVVTAWETLPLLDAYRNVRTRPYARSVLAQTDRFLATTERAREALLLEGAPAGRIVVNPPGVELERFAAAREARPPADGSHLILSAGRLVWEKGHQDVLRALALLRVRGRVDVRALIVGEGPEGARLRELAANLGLAERVEFRASVPYDEMPAVYARASCLVLASIPVRFWEEQFGMVLAEAMAGHLPIVASSERRDPGGRRPACAVRRARRLGRPGRRARARSARRRARCAAGAAGGPPAAVLGRGGRRAPARDLRRAARADAMTADVVIVTWRSGERVLGCLERLAAQQPPARTFVVDNASGDGTIERVRERFPAVQTIELAENRGFGAGVNAGASAGDGEAIVLVNDDVEIVDGCIEALLAPLRADARCAMVAGMTTIPGSDAVDGFGIELDVTLAAYNRLRHRAPHEPHGRLAMPSGGLAAYRRAAFEQVGGFDERLFAYGEDVDLGLRLRIAGWTAAEAPAARGIHEGGASVGVGSPRQRELFGFARGFVLARYGVVHTRAAWRALLVEALVVGWAAARHRTLLPLRARVRGYRAARGERLRAPSDAIEQSISLAAALGRLRER